jgi:hypothetical protein
MNRLLIAAGLFASVACFSANAQTAAMTANIPFEFRMGNVPMPAGEYTINQTGPIFRLQPVEQPKQTAVVLAIPNTVRYQEGLKGKLVFNRYGDRYFLSTVHSAGHETGYLVRPGSAEKELIASSARSGVQTAAVALRRK